MVNIRNGKLFIRSLIMDHVMVGVLSVPDTMKGELMYPGLAGPSGEILISPKQESPTIKPNADVESLDIHALSTSLKFRAGLKENCMEFFFRDTEIPSRQPGYKWVIALGASRQHGMLPSVMLAFDEGEFSYSQREFPGKNLSQVLGLPIWGYEDDPYALFHTLNIQHAKTGLHESRRQRAESDPHFKIFMDYVIEKLGEPKSCYTRDEMYIRANTIPKIYQEASLALDKAMNTNALTRSSN